MKYLNCLFTLVTLFLVQLHESSSYQQELKLFEDYQGMTLLHSYHTGVPDFYEDKAKRVRRYCTRGLWGRYSGKNYSSPLGHTYFTSEHEACFNAANGTYISLLNSFRPLGAEDTDVDAISLYPLRFTGAETLIVQPMYTGLAHPKTGGVAITGKSGWLAFEGQNFNGTSKCLSPKPQASTAYWSAAEVAGLAGIGSVLKGCQRTLTTEYLERVGKDWATQLENSVRNTA